MGILKNKAMWGGFLLAMAVVYVGTHYSVPVVSTAANKIAGKA